MLRSQGLNVELTKSVNVAHNLTDLALLYGLEVHAMRELNITSMKAIRADTLCVLKEHLKLY
jgi:hypothetical protein